jgi:arginyl-tRNA synthetase
MNYLDSIKKEIQNALEKHNNNVVVNFTVDIPELGHGDVTTNVCLVAAKALGKSPQEVFALIEKDLRKSLEKICENIEFKNPGFINFWLKKDFIRKGGKVEEENVFVNILNYFLGNKENLYKTKYAGKKVLVEYMSVNLFKPFTIGHLMNNFVGEFLVRACQTAGAQVNTCSFPSDISLGIAKAVYVIKQDGGLAQDIFKKNEEEIVKYLSTAYVRGVAQYKQWEEEGNDAKIKDVRNIANNFYGNIESEDLKIYNFAKEKNITYFYQMLEKLGSHMDKHFFESICGPEGMKVIEKNLGAVFTKSEGAVVYIPDESRKDLNTLVFVNSDGNPTYEAKDVGLISLKFKTFSPDFSLFVTDSEQVHRFKVILDAVSKINKDWNEKSTHILHGRMTFKGQKMSSRLGGVPTADEVIETILESVKEKSGERKIDDATQREIALSALRIAILRAKPGVNIDFDPEKALSFEGDSGPYLCYTSARLHSLLQKGKENGLLPGCKLSHVGTELNLERKIFQFEKVLSTTIEELAPQKLVTYLFELAGEFNHFYNSTKIISDDKENKFETEHYLYVVQKTLNVLVKGLHILGVKAPEKM